MDKFRTPVTVQAAQVTAETFDEPKTRATIRSHANLKARFLEDQRKQDPFNQEPAAGKRIDPNSTEGRAIAKRLAKPKDGPRR